MSAAMASAASQALAMSAAGGDPGLAPRAPGSFHWTRSVEPGAWRSWERTVPHGDWPAPFAPGHSPVPQGSYQRGDGHPHPNAMWGTRAPPEYLPAGERVDRVHKAVWSTGDNHHELPRHSWYADTRARFLAKTTTQPNLLRFDALPKGPEAYRQAGVTTDFFGDVFFRTQLGRFDDQSLRSFSAAETMQKTLSMPQLL